MTRAIDVLGLGTVTVDELAFVSRYPEPDGKVGDPAAHRGNAAG